MENASCARRATDIEQSPAFMEGFKKAKIELKKYATLDVCG